MLLKDTVVLYHCNFSCESNALADMVLYSRTILGCSQLTDMCCREVQVYTAGIENVVKVWDLRKEEVTMTLKGHNDTITGIALSPDGTHLLTNAMDNTLRV